MECRDYIYAASFECPLSTEDARIPDGLYTSRTWLSCRSKRRAFFPSIHARRRPSFLYVFFFLSFSLAQILSHPKGGGFVSSSYPLERNEDAALWPHHKGAIGAFLSVCSHVYRFLRAFFSSCPHSILYNERGATWKICDFCSLYAAPTDLSGILLIWGSSISRFILLFHDFILIYSYNHSHDSTCNFSFLRL